MGIQQMLMSAAGVSVIPSGFSWLLESYVVGASAITSLTLKTDGTATAVGGTVSGWTTSASAGIGSSYWVEFVYVSGTGNTFTGTLATRLALTTDRTVTLARVTSGDSDRFLTVNIYNAASGGSLVSTGSLSLISQWI